MNDLVGFRTLLNLSNWARKVIRAFPKGVSLLIGIMMLSFIVASCGQSTNGPSALEIKTDSIYVALDGQNSIQHGYDVYRSYGCVLCHGLNGEGGKKNMNAQTGEEIPSLTYTAEGFTKSEFQEKVHAGVRRIAKLDSTGITPPLKMPAWDNMTEAELNDLTLYVWNLYPEEEEDDW